MVTTKETISVIIPCHVFDTALDTCLQALQEYPDAFEEVILVLDGFTGDSSFLANRPISGLIVEEIKERSGPAHARNVGASRAKGELLLFLDSDVELVSNVFNQARSMMRQSNSPAAIIGSYDSAPADKGTVSRFRNLLHHYIHQTSDPNVATFWGACGVVKADLFHKVGGFDERFQQASVEDIELGYRLSHRGARICLCPEMQVKHLKKWTFLNMLKTDIFLRARPWTLLMINYRQFDNQLNFRKEERWVTVLILLTFTSLFMTSVQPTFISLFLVFGGMSITLKLPFYRFMAKQLSKRKIPWIILLHWIYYLSAMMGYVLGWLDHLGSRTGIVKRNPITFPNR